MKKYRITETEARGLGGQSFKRTKVVELADKAEPPAGAEKVSDTTAVHDWREEEVEPAAPAAPQMP